MKEVHEPLVLCLTNTVATQFTANVLLSIGAKPAMVEEPEEAAELAAQADAVLVNVGTLHTRQADAMRTAIDVCQQRNIPWVLDPVALHVLAYRRHFVQDILNHAAPTLIRGNNDEINCLRNLLYDNLGCVPNQKLGCVPKIAMLATGETDTIYTPEGETLQVTGGTPMLQRVTATGCAQGGICAALLGWGQTPVQAAIKASKLSKKAGERAWTTVQKPGSFLGAWVDALYDLTRSEVKAF